MPADTPRVHFYDAQAFALEGHLELPLKQEIRPQAWVNLPEEGGYYSERAENYRLEGVISFRSAYTQVAGNPALKDGHRWSTLATSVLEDFNILDVVTADRVVAQIATEFHGDDYVPAVTFLGTRFDNLRIAGHPVHLKVNTDFLGARSPDDARYSTGRDFRDRVAAQREAFSTQSNLPVEISARYNRLPSNSAPQESIECSLVTHAEGGYPGRTFGHVIDIPHFGRVYLATVRLVESEYKTETGIHPKTLIKLTMIETKMGCAISGETAVGNSITNGGGRGGG